MDNQNGTTDLLEKFAASIEQLAHTIEGIARIEEEKAETASLGHHDRMDGILKREQVYILKLRGLEQKRLRLAEAMGWKGLTFRQILSQSTAEQAGRLSPLFTRLDSQIKHLREVKETAERMIQVRLREFNQILSAATGEGYDENGNPAKGPSSFFHDRYV